jgi:hypothetical protein
VTHHVVTGATVQPHALQLLRAMVVLDLMQL